MNPPRIQSCIELPLPRDILEETIDKAKDYTLMHGVSMHSKAGFDRNQVGIAPFILLPSCFPRREFEKSRRIQTVLNALTHKVAHDHEFLTENLKSTVEVDNFTARLFDIYKTVHAEGHTQEYSLGLLRSDYMLHSDSDMKIIQVELNTIASSFAGLATEVSKYHRYIFKELGHSDKIENIPENEAATGLAGGLVDAWSIYENNKCRTNQQCVEQECREHSVILFVVEDVTYNICDQKALEFAIRRRDPRIKVVRRTFKNLIAKGAHLGPDNELIVEGNVVSVVYYRTGYQSEAYTGEADWSIRLLIERSRAIKCPSIQYHLAGTKKIQQALAQSGILNRYLKEEEAREIQDVFTGLYSLEFDENGEKAVTMAIANPTKYVLKPQREGGGNNVYDENVRTALQSMKESKERTGWILMDRINPPIHKNYLIRSGAIGEIGLRDLVSELGIYGVVIGNKNEICVNRQVGHVLRTKPANANEGGIVAGEGALDSPYLVVNKNEICVNRQVGHVLRTKPANANEGGIVAGEGALDSPYLVV